jgi:hypothetical protein
MSARDGVPGRTRSLTVGELERLDRELFAQEVSWRALAARFKISTDRVGRRARALGLSPKRGGDPAHGPDPDGISAG